MGRRISDEVEGKISKVLFEEFSETDRDEFLRKELKRYVPQLAGWDDEAIREFAAVQRGVWLNGESPALGVPIAFLNPTFIDSVDGIVVQSRKCDLYTRASEKENGYRMQVHRGLGSKVAFTRQFTSYDLRMFPELNDTIKALPIMIGDAELVSKHYDHLAGFNRVQVRIPGVKFWPNRGTHTIDKDLLEEYLTQGVIKRGKRVKLFEGVEVSPEYEITLAFHGLLAIAHPDTWEQSRTKQIESLESMCDIPMNYRRVDEILDLLEGFIEDKCLNARVTERKVIERKKDLRAYVQEKDEKGLEGVVVVQHGVDDSGPLVEFGKSIKIKKYETIDTVLLGIYLGRKTDGLVEENMKGALLGLYDENFGCYLPVCKVNLDPEGVQIKTQGQQDRLNDLREELVDVLSGNDGSGEIVTLYDAYMMEAKIKLSMYLGEIDEERVERMIDSIPRGQDLTSLLVMYTINRPAYRDGLGSKKAATKKDKWIHEYQDIIDEIQGLDDETRNKDLKQFFYGASGIKKVSRKLIKPQFVLDTQNPIIVEAQVFDIKWGLNPMAAGFHSWFLNSFQFNNCFAETLRHDKSSTTDYQTIFRIARYNTIK